MYVVGTLIPAQVITDVEMKLLPVTVSVKLADPAMAVVGEMEFKIGTGLLVVPPPPPPEESDLLHELINNKKRKNDSSLVVLINWLFMPVDVTNIENLLRSR